MLDNMLLCLDICIFHLAFLLFVFSKIRNKTGKVKSLAAIKRDSLLYLFHPRNKKEIFIDFLTYKR